MQVALYTEHYTLPFGDHPTQPEVMFAPDILADWPTKECASEDVFLHATWIWPILMGLYLVNQPMLAHVSVGARDGRILPFNRMWIQISTYPKKIHKGIPLITHNGEIQVALLWNPSEGTLSPRSIKNAKGNTDTEYLSEIWWRNFFTTQLQTVQRERYAEAKNLLKYTQGELALWSRYSI